MPTTKSISLPELADYRRKTDLASKFLKELLAGYLQTLRPLLAPERILGRYAGGRVDLTGAERVLATLKEKFKPFGAKPYDLPLEFDLHWLTLVGTQLELHPWEYALEVPGGGASKTVTMSSPVRWVVNFRCGYTFNQFREAVAGRSERRPEEIRQFVVNALVLGQVIAAHPEVGRLLSDLRYEVHVEAAPGFSALPLVTIASSLGSFRPADDLILAATSFSGIAAFIELIDPDAVATLQDPLRSRLEAALAGA